MTKEMLNDLKILSEWGFDFHLIEDGKYKILCNSLNEKAFFIHLFKVGVLELSVFDKYSFRDRIAGEGRVQKFINKYKMLGVIKCSSNHIWVRPRYAKTCGFFIKGGDLVAD